MTAARRYGRLSWLCRRGMKELDVLLEQFLDINREVLETGAWPELEALLQSEDDVLWDWTRQPKQCPRQEWHELLTAIRGGAERAV